MGQSDNYNKLVTAAKKCYDEEDFMGAYTNYINAGTCAKTIWENSFDNSIKMEYKGYYESCYRAAKICKTAMQKQNGVKAGGDNKMASKNAKGLLQKHDPKNAITFKDVAGLDDVKDAIINQVIKPLNYPEKAKRYNIEPGAMMMLYGLPGTGKTLIARALAGEVDADFYEIRCQDMISKYVGESSKMLQAAFDEALKSERVIMFFDEFDSIAAKRSDATDGADQEMARFVSTFLTNIGSAKKHPTNKMLLIITATNRPWAIDEAMLRGQRIDQQFYVKLPDDEGIKFLVDKEFKGIDKASDYDEREIISLFRGYGCSDIVAICKRIRNKLFVRDIRTNQPQSITRKDYVNGIRSQQKSYSMDTFKKFEDYYKKTKKPEDED